MNKADNMDCYQYFEKATAREIYGKKLVELGKKYENLVVLTADTMNSTRTVEFAVYKERLLNIGISEQNMMSIAAGLAIEGKIPIASTFATFASMRVCEQVRTDICYPNLNVKIVATHSGLTSGGGPTHYAQEDLAIMRSLVNMTVIVPGDPNQISKVLEAAMIHKGPVYIRIGRGGEAIIYREDYKYEIGKSIMVKEGKDATIIACGVIISLALEAASRLAKEGIDVGVIDMHTIKPIDTGAIIKAANNTGVVVTCEDHNITGGLGSAVAEVIAEEHLFCKFKRIGIPDVYGVIGSLDELFHKYGYDSEGIYNTLKSII